MKKLLFVCSQNRLRSPTAERVFARWPGVETASAGTDVAADNPLTAELVAWADLIFVMEPAHRRKLQRKCRAALNGKRVICLGIPDEYDYMDAALIALLERTVPPFLPQLKAPQ